MEKKLACLSEKLSSKTAAVAEIQSKFNALTSKYESSERSVSKIHNIVGGKIFMLNRIFQFFSLYTLYSKQYFDKVNYYSLKNC